MRKDQIPISSEVEDLWSGPRPQVGDDRRIGQPIEVASSVFSVIQHVCVFRLSKLLCFRTGQRRTSASSSRSSSPAQLPPTPCGEAPARGGKRRRAGPDPHSLRSRAHRPRQLPQPGLVACRRARRADAAEAHPSLRAEAHLGLAPPRPWDSDQVGPEERRVGNREDAPRRVRALPAERDARLRRRGYAPKRTPGAPGRARDHRAEGGAPRQARESTARKGSRRPDSNRRPADYESAALPAELRRLGTGQVRDGAAYPATLRTAMRATAVSARTRPG